MIDPALQPEIDVMSFDERMELVKYTERTIDPRGFARRALWTSVAELPAIVGPGTGSMTAKRQELIRLIEGMTEDQVEALLAHARRRAFPKPKTT